MNSLLCLDPSIMYQQQLMLQQMIIYNSMLLGSIKNITQPFVAIPQQVPQNKVNQQQDVSEKSQNPNPTIQKQKEDTKPLPPIAKSIQKQSKRKEDQKPKKKIFLSMMDIKNIQYKKFKETDLRIKDKQDTSNEIQ